MGLYSLIVAMIVTVVIMIYAAQPWSDNVANQTLTDTIYLVAFSFWSIVPYLTLMLFIHLFRKHKPSFYAANIGAGIIIVASLAFLIDSIFIHRDAQGAFLFLFLPIYQWLAILILALICAIVFQTIKKSEDR